jgi:O-antigen/teichoic acid export membrane protein
VAGIYDKGYGLGAGVKFALSAFEPAWQPFVFSAVGKGDAKDTIARVVSYVWLAFVTSGLGLAVFGRELLMLLTFTRPEFWEGAPVVPVIVGAYLLHGVFLLTSIGVGIEKRTRYYPVITGTAAVSNVVLNLVLVPPFGMMGAAWATLLSYAVMAAGGFRFSQRLYPIPFRYSRLARISVAGLATYALSLLAPSPLLWGVAFKATAFLAFPLVLWLFGAWSWAEVRALRKDLAGTNAGPGSTRRGV